jgi:hypothetical protein
MGRNFNYGDIARVAAGLSKDDLTQFAGTIEGITELPRMQVADILRGLMNGTICAALPKDARELLIAMAQTELRFNR